MFFSCHSATPSAVATTQAPILTCEQHARNTTSRKGQPQGCVLHLQDSALTQYANRRCVARAQRKRSCETCAKISAAQAPEGPPPTTATRILRPLSNLVPMRRLVARPERMAPALQEDKVSVHGMQGAHSSRPSAASSGSVSHFDA